jgi:hypothetical protein
VCVMNDGYEASLQVLKIYEHIPDARGEHDGLIRVIDEEGEDYLYPQNFFIPLELPKDIEDTLESAAELEAKHG